MLKYLKIVSVAAAALASAALSLPAAAQVNGSAQATGGSEQRRAILDALRPAVEARLGPDVEFVVSRIDVERGWALVAADPQRRGGGKIDARRAFTPEQREIMDGITVTAVLRFQNQRWNLVENRFGATDVWYCNTGPASFLKC